MAKNIQFIGNIQKNTKKIIVDSNIELGGLKNGSLLRFDNENYFYTVEKTEETRIIKDFNVINNSTIEVQDYQHSFVQNDLLEITFKQFELLTVEKILSTELPFSDNENIYVDGGVLWKETLDNTEDKTLFRVSTKSTIPISIVSKGRYLVPPENPCKLVSNNGSFILANLQYKKLDDAKIIEKSISSIAKQNNKFILTLDSSLQEGIKEGKISTRKWVVYLNENYDGDTKMGITCSLSADFSPNYGFPLIAKNSLSHELLQNRTTLMLDGKLAELEARIKSLESR